MVKPWRLLFEYPEKDMLRLYNDIYIKWSNELTRLETNIFEWEGLPCPNSTMELYLIRDGVIGNVIDKKQGNIIACGSMAGITNYPNVFKQFIYTTSLTNGVFTIDKEGVICKANRLAQSDLDCIDLYSHLLTHVDLSIQTLLINMRANNAFGAKNDAQKNSILAWLRSVRNGKPNVIMDKSSLSDIIGDAGVTTLPTYNHTHGELIELYEMRQNLLRDYFAERGFMSDKAKTERLVTAELSVNIYRTIFAISDMLEEREKFCERAQRVLGNKYNVKYNKNIQDQIDTMLQGGVTNNVESATQDSNGNTE